MFNGGSTSLKFYKRLGIYKNSTGTVQFNPETLIGKSYNWTFVAPIDGQLVFNNYTWSSTTSCHQTALSCLLRELKLNVVRGDFGRVNVYNIGLDSIINLHKELFKLIVEIECAVKQESYAQNRRIRQKEEVLNSIQTLETLSNKFRVSVKKKKELMLEAQENELNRVSDLESKKCFKFLSLKNASEDVNAIDLKGML